MVKQRAEMTLVAVLLQHVVQRGHPVAVLNVHVGAALEERFRRAKMTALHRAEEGGLVFSNRIDVGTMVEQHRDGGDVVLECGRPQAVIRVAPALQEMGGESQILASRDRVPQRCGLPVMLAERLLVDVDASAQEHVGCADAVDRGQLLLLHVDTAADVKKVPSSIVSIRNQLRIGGEARFHVTPAEALDRLQHSRSRCHACLPRCQRRCVRNTSADS